MERLHILAGAFWNVLGGWLLAAVIVGAVAAAGRW